ncbi:MAG TPA: hypothetical protein VF139_10345 [Candidatus Polarisedimenticolaceae bacterium]
MNRRSILRSFAYAAFFACVLTTSFACGGGGGDDTPSGILTATFTPDNPNPGANTVSMQAGSSSATDFNIDVSVTQTNDVFGAAFDVTFPSASVSYQSFDMTGSLLNGAGVTVSTTVDPFAPGRLIVAVTRVQNVGGTVPSVDVGATAKLITLRFRARTAFLPTAISFDATQPRQVRNELNQSIPVTWSSGSAAAAIN